MTRIEHIGAFAGERYANVLHVYSTCEGVRFRIRSAGHANLRKSAGWQKHP
jgi:hypothetical protein